MGITVKTKDRSHRIVYLVVLLLFAVALTTALVLAGERNPESIKKSTLHSITPPHSAPFACGGMINV
jgi:hypothetical protein